MTVRIQIADFDLASEHQALRQLGGKTGAIVSFTGLVRDYFEDQTILAMTLEHYPGMTEKVLEDIEQQARARWDLLEVAIIHRVGYLDANEQIVLVLVSSGHRQDAFLACQFIMDFLKTQAPFWKKEHTSLGGHWVTAKQSDQEQVEQW